MRIKITSLDALFSKYIRWIRDKGICQRCLKAYKPPSSALHCSHFWGRARKSTRFDPDNVAALCYGCHMHFTANPVEHRDFFFKRLGCKKYDLLMLRACNPSKMDYKLIKIWLEKELANAEKEIVGKKA